MTKSELFKAAHKLAKATVKAGDNYQATFALCLKAVYAQSSSNIINIDFAKRCEFFQENNIKLGTAKNGSDYAEVVVGSEFHNKLLNGLTIIASDSKGRGSRTYDFNGECGKEFYNHEAQLVVRFYGKITTKKGA